uniref:Uncharacterized protein n=1 Tax=Anguilla anguilla TaxID=7936 RepID=A0A0E9U2N5_ANGAN
MKNCSAWGVSQKLVDDSFIGCDFFFKSVHLRIIVTYKVLFRIYTIIINIKQTL